MSDAIVEQKVAFFHWMDKLLHTESIERIELEHMGQYGQNAHVTHWYMRPDDGIEVATEIYDTAVEDARCFAGSQKYCVLVHPTPEKMPQDPGDPTPAWARTIGAEKPSRKIFSVLGGEIATTSDPTAKAYEAIVPMIEKVLGGIDDQKLRVERMVCATRILGEMLHKDGYDRETLPQQIAIAAKTACELESLLEKPTR